MLSAGKIALLLFPFSDSPQSKLRPVLVIKALPGSHHDWLVCMVSSKLHQAHEGLDEIVHTDSDDFALSGLKGESLVRVTRLAVVNTGSIRGIIGHVSETRLVRVRQRLSLWLAAE